VNEANSREAWIEIVSTVLISAAALLQAWGGYQSALWNSVMIAKFHESATASTQAANEAQTANQKRASDAALFVQFAEAYSVGNKRLADFIRERFRPEARPALDAWLAKRPLKNPDAPATPFELPQYQIKEEAKAQALFKTADDKYEEGKQANLASDSYIRAVVAMASVSFLGGISTKPHGRTSRAILVLVAALVLCFAVIQILLLPLARVGA
jgi:hypothetical protein